MDPLANSDKPAATHRRRWCQGGTPDQGEPVGGGRVEGGSPRRADDDEGVSDDVDENDDKGVGGDVDDGDSSDKMLPVAKVWTQAGCEVMWSSSK
jgi:hypothetical protein